jgi:chromosome segregation ATPase
MGDPDIHLKLDRILAGQSQISARMDEHAETIRVLISTMSIMHEAVSTQTETIDQLSEAMSREEEAGELATALASMADNLKKIQQDSARTVVLISRLPDAVAQAAQDAVAMALGDGVDIPPGEHE